MDRRTSSDHCAGEFPDSIAAFSNLSDLRTLRNKKSWLRKFLNLPSGIPSDDTFRRVFSAINSKAFNVCFIAFTENFSSELSSQLIAIDGKAILHCFDHEAEPSHLHHSELISPPVQRSHQDLLLPTDRPHRPSFL
ncbi:transposase family protein, partial [Akkermansiaceae bacterium]|nr:transposase family protein [Akkermansiaceae bacterium]